MNTSLTDEQKKNNRIAVALFISGALLGGIIAIIFKDKQIAKLEAKILKLEGWQ